MRILHHPAYKLLLNIYPGAAVGYSLRRLSRSYFGNCVLVRRSSDNAEQAIGFVNNVIDTAALLYFVGSGDGFVKTWYDQSGNNNHASQTDPTYQPKIVSSGAIYTVNSKPAFLVNNLSVLYTHSMILISTLSALNDHSVYVVGKREATNRHFYLINGAYSAYMQYAGGTFYAQIPSGGGQIKFNYASDNTIVHSLFEAYQQSQVQTIYRNNSQYTLNEGILGGFNNTFNQVCYASYGYYQEIVFYQSDKTADRSGIIGNINKFYGIY